MKMQSHRLASETGKGGCPISNTAALSSAPLIRATTSKNSEVRILWNNFETQCKAHLSLLSNREITCLKTGRGNALIPVSGTFFATGLLGCDVVFPAFFDGTGLFLVGS